MPNRPPLIVQRQRLWKPNFPGDLPRVNWSHPLAKGLTHLYLLTDATRTVYNLANLNDGGGSLQASVTKGSTPAGPGLTFDGSASHNLTLTKGLPVTGVDFTAEIYFKLTNLPSSGFNYDMLSGPAESNGLLVSNGGTNTVLSFDTDLTGALSNTALAINTWYHAVMTCSSGGTGNVYINGKADTANPLSVGGTQTNPLTNVGGSSNAGFPGTIGWFRFWSRVLSQAEALELYLDPWAMLNEGGQHRRTFAILGGSSSGTTTQQTLTGTARITAQTQKTLTSTARITVTTQRTLTGTARITVTTPKTLTAVARITAQTQKTLTAVARVTATTSKTLTAVARVTAQTQKTITATARVTATTQKTLTAVARVTATSTKTLTAISRITAKTQKTLTSTANIQVTGTTQRTLTATARITAKTTKTLTSTARVQVTSTQTLTGKARIQITTQRTLTAVARVRVTVLRTQAATARITAKTIRTLTGTAHIAPPAGATQGATVGVSSRPAVTVTASDRRAVTVTASDRKAATVGVSSRLP